MELDNNSVNSSNTNINNRRCIGLNIHKKKCRNRIRDDNPFFCCKNHEPINNEFIYNGCFTCSEIISDANNIIIFDCNHIFHKECYVDWLKYSTYGKPICLICKKDVELNNSNKVKKKKYISEDNNYIYKNLNILGYY
jgi:hypothetical protein